MSTQLTLGSLPSCRLPLLRTLESLSSHQLHQLLNHQIHHLQQPRCQPSNRLWLLRRHLVLCLLVLLIHGLHGLHGLLVHVQHYTVDGHFPAHWLSIFAVIRSLLNYVATPVSQAVGIWTSPAAALLTASTLDCLITAAASAVGLQNCFVATNGS